MKKMVELAGVECYTLLQQQEFGLNSDWEIEHNVIKSKSIPIEKSNPMWYEIKAKPTLRCNLKIVCSRILLNCPRHLCQTEVPLHCSSSTTLCPTSFVNDLVFCQLLWSRKENWLFSDYPSIPLAESKCWTPSRTFCPRISPKLPPLPHHQRRNRRRTGCSHLMGNSSFLFAFST